MNMITDFHTHAFPDDLAPHAIDELEKLQGDNQTGAYLDGTIADLLQSMDETGIDRSVICSIATAPEQVPSIREWSLRIADKRIIPFGSLHPDMEDPEGAAAEMAEKGIAGIKIHPQYQNFDLGDRSTWVLFEAIAKQPLICVLHCGLDFAFPMDDERAHPTKVAAIHEKFPDMPLVAAHMGGWKRWECVAESLAGSDVYFETSYTFGYASVPLLNAIVERHSTDKILFGSDSPWQDQKDTLDGVRNMFGSSDCQKVISDNAQDLFALIDYQTPVS